MIIMGSHIVGLFIHPRDEWLQIRNEVTEQKNRYLLHMLVLAAIPAIFGYYGVTEVGWSPRPGESTTFTTESALTIAVVAYLATLGAITFMGFFIHWMARSYGSDPSRRKCIVFAAYTATPLFLVGIMGGYPHLMLTILGAIAGASYSAYLLYLGIPLVMEVPKERGFLFSTSVLAVGLVVLVAMMMLTVVAWEMGLGPVWN